MHNVFTNFTSFCLQYDPQYHGSSLVIPHCRLNLTSKRFSRLDFIRRKKNDKQRSIAIQLQVSVRYKYHYKLDLACDLCKQLVKHAAFVYFPVAGMKWIVLLRRRVPHIITRLIEHDNGNTKSNHDGTPD